MTNDVRIDVGQSDGGGVPPAGPGPEAALEWRDAATRDLFEAIVGLPDRVAAERFFRDLCTLNELRDMAQRWHVVQLLENGRHYLDISRETGASTATITRIAQWLRHGTGGYAEALARGSGVNTGPGSDRGSQP